MTHQSKVAVVQLVERRLAKAKVASSSLVYRSIKVLTLFIKSDKIKHVMRALHSGSASAFQADSAGSIPAARSIRRTGQYVLFFFCIKYFKKINIIKDNR